MAGDLGRVGASKGRSLLPLGPSSLRGALEAFDKLVRAAYTDEAFKAISSEWGFAEERLRAAAAALDEELAGEVEEEQEWGGSVREEEGVVQEEVGGQEVQEVQQQQQQQQQQMQVEGEAQAQVQVQVLQVLQHLRAMEDEEEALR